MHSKKKKRSLLIRFLTWRIRHVSDKQFMLFAAVLVGLLAGLAAVVIKNSVHLIRSLVTYGFAKEFENYLYFAYPTIGILITVIFLKYVLRKKVGHGIPSVLYSISRNNSKIERHNMFSSIITSAFTVGFGGSVGLEGPTVATGAAFGSNIGRLFHLNHKQTTLLLGCACAGAMSAIFKAPVAAIVFALEVIMLDLTMASMVPLLMASASAILTSYLFFGQDVIYNFESTNVSFKITDIPFYATLGIIAGLISVYYTKIYMHIGKVFDSIKKTYIKLFLGGSILGIMIFFFPSLYGEGYESVNQCLKGEYMHVFNNSLFYNYQDEIIISFILLIVIILLKVIATAITFGSGGVGGIFAPTLFMGANLGLLFAKFINHYNLNSLNIGSFALAGMAGLIAGVLHAPLTAIFLIADLTGGYGLFVPLMITASISYATIRYFEPNSVYTIQLARRKQLITHNKDKSVLSMMTVEKLIENNFITIDEQANLGDLVNAVTQSERNVYPILRDNKYFLGTVNLNNIRHIMFKPEMYENTTVISLMSRPEITVSPEDSMEDVARKIQSTGSFNIPVVKNGEYVGFVSRANVFSTYRKLLKRFSGD